MIDKSIVRVTCAQKASNCRNVSCGFGSFTIIPLTYYQKSRLKSKLMPICFHIRKLADYEVSVKEKRDLLKDPQIGEGVFSLISTVLPALISLLTQK